MASIVTVPRDLVGDAAPESQSLVHDHRDVEVLHLHYHLGFAADIVLSKISI